jgi:predicted transglutaminase-like cysteine proteinase
MTPFSASLPTPPTSYSSLCSFLFYFRIYLLLSFFFIFPTRASATSDQLFSYTEEHQQSSVHAFSQWVNVVERHPIYDIADGDTEQHRHLKKWFSFLESIKNQPPLEQIKAVNKYANEKKYILDIINYGLEEYWAIVKEFLYNNGDCEDYAITKFYSLRWLGFRNDDLRVVVLQDTNLRIPHAVLAVYHGGDILILDNQISRVVSHKQIVHYVPIYSINEKQWWLHLPPI